MVYRLIARLVLPKGALRGLFVAKEWRMPRSTAHFSRRMGAGTCDDFNCTLCRCLHWSWYGSPYRDRDRRACGC